MVFAGNLALTGNTVVIDHGCGLRSYLYGLQELSVSKGQTVEKGQAVGVLGEELTMDFKLGSKSVNPRLLFQTSGGLVLEGKRLSRNDIGGIALKKRIIAWAVLLSVCAAALGLWCSAATGKTARTLPCEEEGLILSITTFDGKSESKPFLKCFGHTWIGLDNRTGHTVYLKDRAIPDGEMVTFSVWAVSGLSGLLFDLEPCYIANYGRYTGRLSLSTNIGEEQLKVIEDYMEQHDKWTVDKNCSYWSIHLWNAVVGEDAALKIRGFVCTPRKN